MAKTIKGKLAVLAKTAGLKLNIAGQDTNWINPTDEAKKNILENVDKINKMKGELVEVILEDDGKYSAIAIHKEQEEEEAQTEDLSDEEIAAQYDSQMKESEEFQNKVVDEAKKQLKEVAKEIAKKVMPEVKKEIVKDGTQCKEQFNESSYKKVGTLKVGEESYGIVSEEKVTESGYFKKLYAESDMESKKIAAGTRDLTYISWAEAWAKLKEHYPDANYEVHENSSGMPYFFDRTGGFVKVSVKVCGMTHTIHLPIMDSRNQTIAPDRINAFNINKSIQRALAKGIAMHGLGLKIYKGEDLKDE